MQLWLLNDTSLQIVDSFISKLHSNISSAYLRSIISQVFSLNPSTSALFEGPISMTDILNYLQVVKGDFKYLQIQSLSEEYKSSADNFALSVERESKALESAIQHAYIRIRNGENYFFENNIMQLLDKYKPHLTGRSIQSLREGISSDRSCIDGSLDGNLRSWSTTDESALEAKSLVSRGIPASAKVHLLVPRGRRAGEEC